MSKIYRSDQTLVLNDILHALDDIKDLLQKRESQHAALPVPVVDEVVVFDSIVSEQHDVRFLYKGPTVTLLTRIEGDRLRLLAYRVGEE